MFHPNGNRDSLEFMGLACFLANDTCSTGNDVFNVLHDQELELCLKIKSQGRNTVKFWETLVRMGVDSPFVFGMAFGLSS